MQKVNVGHMTGFQPINSYLTGTLDDCQHIISTVISVWGMYSLIFGNNFQSHVIVESRVVLWIPWFSIEILLCNSYLAPILHWWGRLRVAYYHPTITRRQMLCFKTLLWVGNDQVKTSMCFAWGLPYWNLFTFTSTTMSNWPVGFSKWYI